jgi:N utilization substance protein A
LADMTPEQLEAIEGIGPKTVEKISLAVNNYFASLEGGEVVTELPEGEAAPEEEGAAVEEGAVAEEGAERVEVAASEEPSGEQPSEEETVAEEPAAEEHKE